MAVETIPNDDATWESVRTTANENFAALSRQNFTNISDIAYGILSNSSGPRYVFGGGRVLITETLTPSSITGGSASDFYQTHRIRGSLGDVITMAFEVGHTFPDNTLIHWRLRTPNEIIKETSLITFGKDIVWRLVAVVTSDWAANGAYIDMAASNPAVPNNSRYSLRQRVLTIVRQDRVPAGV